MGYNSTVVILNDGLSQIEKDPEFGKKISDAIHRLGIERGSIIISSGNHCNPAAVVETHHADITAIVAVGGNYATVLDHVHGYCHHEEENKLGIVKQLASSLGYRLIPKKMKIGYDLPGEKNAGD